VSRARATYATLFGDLPRPAGSAATIDTRRAETRSGLGCACGTGERDPTKGRGRPKKHRHGTMAESDPTRTQPSDLGASMKSSREAAHLSISSSAGQSASPQSVRPYSTLGGT
jgi:hypothetical protein